MVEGQALGNDVACRRSDARARLCASSPTKSSASFSWQVQGHIRGHLEFAADQVGSAGLVHVSRDSVEDIPASGRLRGDHRLRYHVQDDLVGHQFAAVQIRLDGLAERGPPRHVIAQQFTGRDVRDVEVRGDQRALSPFARAWGRDHRVLHHSSPTSSSAPRPALIARLAKARRQETCAELPVMRPRTPGGLWHCPGLEAQGPGQAPTTPPVDSGNEEGSRAPGLFSRSRRRDPHLD